MKYYKFKARIINLDGTEYPMTVSIPSLTKEEAEDRFYTHIRTENGDLLEIVNFEYLGIHV